MRDGSSKSQINLPDWFRTVDGTPDITVTPLGQCHRMMRGYRTFMLIELHLPDVPESQGLSSPSSAPFRHYSSPRHTRLIALLHRVGSRTDSLSAIGSSWRIGANRSVLRVDLFGVLGGGRLVLYTADSRTELAERTIRVTRGYLGISGLPYGEYEVSWEPANERPRPFRNLTAMRNSLCPTRQVRRIRARNTASLWPPDARSVNAAAGASNRIRVSVSRTRSEPTHSAGAAVRRGRTGAGRRQGKPRPPLAR